MKQMIVVVGYDHISPVTPHNDCVVDIVDMQEVTMNNTPTARRQAITWIWYFQILGKHLAYPVPTGFGMLSQYDLRRSESWNIAHHGMSYQSIKPEPPAGVDLFDNHPGRRINWNGLLASLNAGTNNPPFKWLCFQARVNSGFAFNTFRIELLALPSGAMFTRILSKYRALISYLKMKRNISS